MRKTKRKINMKKVNMKKVNMTKINRKKINRKKRGTRRRRSCHKGGTILGSGGDGCIIDSLSCGGFSKETGYVAKILKNESRINHEVNNKLAIIDPNNKRFNRYYFPSGTACSQDIEENSDILYLKSRGEFNGIFGFQKYLIYMDPMAMTKEQYRHLRESIEILKTNKISHGDLPGNVMFDPHDKLPRIIDWENASFTEEELKFTIDWNAFLTHFRVSS
jgi:hypothetical protein